jgi:hypothetical protein
MEPDAIGAERVIRSPALGGGEDGDPVRKIKFLERIGRRSFGSKP